MRAALLAMPCAAVAAGLSPSGAVAQDDGFYKGKTINIIVGFSPGGGYDAYARMLARYYGAHIPGTPNVIVQNMPGAGSLAAVRHVASVAPKDGLTIGAFNPGVITDSLTNPEQVKMKFSDVIFLGSITRDFRMCYAWAGTGIKTIKDLQGGREFIMGGTGPGTGNYINGAMLRSLLGLNVKQILGYPGSNELRLGIERGELHGDCGSWSSISEDWIRDKKINAFVSFSPARTPDMPQDVPFAGDLLKDPEKKQILNMLIAAGETGRPYIVAKETPPARVKSLRDAFMATMKDAAFLAEAQKTSLPVNPVDGPTAEKLINAIYQASPEIVAKAKEAIK
jgi:tripartite-type tricarboxylate transporter receptor subunit TctC